MGHLVIAEFLPRALGAVSHSLADIEGVNPPDLPAPRRASALGAGEV
jgi:hypothetical protein